MKYINIENLTAWIEKNLKMPYGCYDLDSVLGEVESQHNASGSTIYELGSHETNSGLPECFSYEVNVEYDEEADSYETSFVF